MSLQTRNTVLVVGAAFCEPLLRIESFAVNSLKMLADIQGPFSNIHLLMGCSSKRIHHLKYTFCTGSSLALLLPTFPAFPCYINHYNSQMIITKYSFSSFESSAYCSLCFLCCCVSPRISHRISCARARQWSLRSVLITPTLIHGRRQEVTSHTKKRHYGIRFKRRSLPNFLVCFIQFY